MILNVMIESYRDTGMEDIIKSIHDNLSHVDDYTRDNIVLNIDENNNQMSVYFNLDDCNSINMIKEKSKEVIDIFIDNL